jgi:hypothetical protein
MTHKVEADRFAARDALTGRDALTEDELDTVSGGVDDYCAAAASLNRALNTWHYLVGKLT